eukprot:CAMPEP_0168594052 /NCGR_PEP_ID=MMETSP0420-20121227/8675_1 /TAXON_ID=498008 /ORGANISM="Pessonella sp." /LENGTH=179 /DNA_ID=CAMNT_0008630311 /DNA_START=390 /DNA_END=926 /DNA_ORIENTATION=-
MNRKHLQQCSYSPTALILCDICSKQMERRELEKHNEIDALKHVSILFSRVAKLEEKLTRSASSTAYEFTIDIKHKGRKSELALNLDRHALKLLVDPRDKETVLTLTADSSRPRAMALHLSIEFEIIKSARANRAGLQHSDDDDDNDDDLRASFSNVVFIPQSCLAHTMRLPSSPLQLRL